MNKYGFTVDDVRYLVEASLAAYNQDALDGFMLNVSVDLASEGAKRVFDLYLDSDLRVRPIEIHPIFLR